jgi:alkanesulfonate monooxygenase SsuD/methylene tetrahydromethanopterin reductase-like flavin-dependent oxidoreductase (luciferase family)
MTDALAKTAEPRTTLRLALDLGSNHDVQLQLVQARDVIAAAEAAGFESVWLGESYHVSPAPFHLPSPLITLAHLGAFTSLRLGTGVLLLRAYDPQKLAYEAALVDQLTGGRLLLGVGLGHPVTSWALHHGPLEENFFDEGLNTLREAWRERDGSTPDGRVAPSPRQPGGPPILVGGYGIRAVQRAAAYGDGYLAATNYSDQLLAVRAREYLDLCGDNPGQVCVNRLCVVREDGEEARRLASRYLESVSGFYASGNAWGIAPDGSADASDGVTLAGTPAEIGGRIEEYASWGVTHVHLRVAPVGMPAHEAIETVRLIGAEVKAGRSP